MVMKIIKFCHYCGKRYYVQNSQKDRSKFCSDECFRKSKNTQVTYPCDCCGIEFLIKKSKVNKRLNGQSKYLCCSSECAKEIQKPKWNDIVSLFNKNNYLLLSDCYINAKTKLEYICLNHQEYGSQYVTYNNLKYGFGCKYCGEEQRLQRRRLPLEEVKKIFDKHDMILLDQEYKNTQQKLAYICKHHKEIGVQYMATVNAYKNYCPYCNIVKGEKVIADFLLKRNIKFKLHQTYEDLIGIKRKELSYDFYLYDYNLLIEFQGEQHDHPVEFFGGERQFEIQQEHDRRKNEYAITHHIDLLEIWYYEFNDIEKILNNKLFNII